MGVEPSLSRSETMRETPPEFCPIFNPCRFEDLSAGHYLRRDFLQVRRRSAPNSEGADALGAARQTIRHCRGSTQSPAEERRERRTDIIPRETRTEVAAHGAGRAQLLPARHLAGVFFFPSTDVAASKGRGGLPDLLTQGQRGGEGCGLVNDLRETRERKRET